MAQNPLFPGPNPDTTESVTNSSKGLTAAERGLRVEPATIEDLPALTELVLELMELQPDFTPRRTAHEKGLRLILEEPSRGRIFVLRNDERIIGMVNLLITISTAMGGFALLMEDVIVHPEHRQAIWREIAKLRLRTNIVFLRDLERRSLQQQQQLDA